MAEKRRGGLGRGLDAIYTDTDFIEEKEVVKLRLSEIEPNHKQPRKSFDNIEELSESIKRIGLISPIIVRKNGFSYTIIAGERRWRASKLAGLDEVPVVVVDADDKKSAEMTLVENVQRKDLNPIELAFGYKDMMDDYNLTQDEVAEMVGKDRSSIANTLRLLELPQEIQLRIADGSISQGHGKALLALKNKEKYIEVCEYIVLKDLSVRETESYVKKVNSNREKKETKQNENSEYIQNLENKLQEKLGRRVKIDSKGNKSEIRLGYTDNDDLEKLITLLCGEEFKDNI